jgi:hypothetical protein
MCGLNYLGQNRGTQMTIFDIIQELNQENGSNYKLSVLRKYSKHEQLKRVLQMTYDRVQYTYGLSLKHWITNQYLNDQIFDTNKPVVYTLDQTLDFMSSQLATRNVTGNEAIARMHEQFLGLSFEDTIVATRVLNRDLRINLGRTQINKIFPDLIVKPCYMRCGIFGAKTSKDIRFPAYIQLKADGTYREAFVSNGKVEFVSRSGESYVYPLLEEELSTVPDGYYTGELLVRGVTNRSESNGLINSDDVPHESVEFHVWDYITPTEYLNAHVKITNKIPYKTRFAELSQIIQKLDSSKIFLIESHEVETLDQALAITSRWMEQDFEGGVLKDKNGLFKNGTSKHQLKLKLEIDVDVRVTAFQEGTPGTIRERTFGALLFETDDGMIRGRTSGFTDDQLHDFNSRREEIVGKIITVRCNDLTRARDNDYYALSHPRFIELRNDKTETDTLQRALDTKNMAKGLSG